MNVKTSAVNMSSEVKTMTFDEWFAQEGWVMVDGGCSHEVVARAAFFVSALVEREACIKVCEGIADHYGEDCCHVADHCAISIREDRQKLNTGDSEPEES